MIDLHISNRIGYITLNRPEKRNALNEALVEELKRAFSSFEANEDVKVIVLRANGEAFCAGADLGYLQQLQKNTYQENLADSNNLKELFAQIYGLKKVVIAQVEGHAIAGGCGLATVCDVVFSVPEAKFGYTEVNIGFIPAIVSIFAIRKIGEATAKELLLSGRLIDANAANQMGFVNYVSPAETIAADVANYAGKMVSRTSGQSLELTKALIGMVQDHNLADGLNNAAAMNATARGTDDCKKGIAAFLNKEKLVW